MPDQDHGDDPTGNANHEPPLQPPVEATVEQRIVTLERQSHTHAAQDDTAKEMKREFRTVEIVTIATNVILAVVGIFALRAYYGQLGAMQNQLAEMRSSSGQTNQLLQLYQRQLEQITRQANDTHDLAVEAKTQANAATISADALKGANAAIVYPNGPVFINDHQLQLAFTNVGQLVSENIKIQLRVVKVTFPELKPIGTVTQESKTFPQISRSTPVGFAFDVKQPTGNTLLNKETIQVDGRYTFNDGFGNWLTGDFCYLYAEGITRRGRPVPMPGFLECSMFKIQMENIISTLKKDAEQGSPQTAPQ